MARAKQLLIDGDILLYRFAHSNQFNIQWDEDTVSQVIHGEVAVHDLERFINDLIENTGAKAAAPIVIFSGANNFRYTVLPTYKHNRVGVVKPELYKPLKDYIRENYVWKEIPTLEGDDTIGILMTRHPGKYVSASIDKDLKQIPGQHYDWNHDKHFVVTEEEGDRVFYMQCLTGDPTDGYHGIPKIGPKKAAAYLDNVEGDLWPAIVAAYENAGLTEADALQQARVARILRVEDYDFEKKEVRLWTP